MRTALPHSRRNRTLPPACRRGREMQREYCVCWTEEKPGNDSPYFCPSLSCAV